MAGQQKKMHYTKEKEIASFAHLIAQGQVFTEVPDEIHNKIKPEDGGAKVLSMRKSEG